LPAEANAKEKMGKDAVPFRTGKGENQERGRKGGGGGAVFPYRLEGREKILPKKKGEKRGAIWNPAKT